MKVKVISSEFKKLATSILPFSGGSILATTGAIGLSFTETHVIIRAFAGTWAWGEIACHVDGYVEDQHLVVSSGGLKVALLYCDGDNTAFDVFSDRLLVGSATIKASAKTTVEDLTPHIDLSHPNWIMLPDQAKRVISTSSTDSKGTHGDATLLHLDPDAIFCVAEGGFYSSTFLVEWELDERILVPIDIARTIARKDGEISFCVVDSILIFAIDRLHIATPQVGSSGLSVEGSEFIKGEWFQASGLGVSSSNLATELDVSILQSDYNRRILLWTSDEGGNDLHFFSPGSEVGSSSGSLWSNLKNFRICVDPAWMRRLIPSGDMWEMAVVSQSEGGTPVLMVKEESGVCHLLQSKVASGNHDEYFQKIIDEFDYKEQIDETE